MTAGGFASLGRGHTATNSSGPRATGRRLRQQLRRLGRLARRDRGLGRRRGELARGARRCRQDLDACRASLRVRERWARRVGWPVLHLEGGRLARRRIAQPVRPPRPGCHVERRRHLDRAARLAHSPGGGHLPSRIIETTSELGHHSRHDCLLHLGPRHRLVPRGRHPGNARAPLCGLRDHERRRAMEAGRRRGAPTCLRQRASPSRCRGGTWGMISPRHRHGWQARPPRADHPTRAVRRVSSRIHRNGKGQRCRHRRSPAGSRRSRSAVQILAGGDPGGDRPVAQRASVRSSVWAVEDQRFGGGFQGNCASTAVPP